MTTERQREANRQNAQHSTGPKTDEGKNIAKRNGIRHGLAGRGVVLPEWFEQLADERASQMNSSLKPWNPFELWLSECIARDQVRIEDCARQQQVVRSGLALRAQLRWDADRQAEAAVLADSIGRKPLAVAGELQTTRHGCELMAAQWKSLAAGLEAKGEWDGPQRSYALDLLGVAAGLRGGPTPLDAPEGSDALAHLKAVVRGEIDRLEGLATGELAELDTQRRYEVEIGLVDQDPRLRLLRRYENECARRMTQFKGMFGQERIGGSYIKASKRDPEPEPRPRYIDEETQRQARERIAAGGRPILPDPEPAEPIVTCVPDPCPEELESLAFEDEGLSRSEPEPEADDLRSTG